MKNLNPLFFASYLLFLLGYSIVNLGFIGLAIGIGALIGVFIFVFLLAKFMDLDSYCDWCISKIKRHSNSPFFILVALYCYFMGCLQPLLYETDRLLFYVNLGTIFTGPFILTFLNKKR